MTSADLLTDGFGRVRERVVEAVEGLSPEGLAFRADADANSIAWLVWHIARVQDDHVAGAAQIDQVYTTKGWADRFGFPFDPGGVGYGHDSAAVAAVTVDSPALLTGYYDAVHEQTVRYVSDLTDADLDRIVDRSWDPPVTLGVRLVSVLDDNLEHAGQAAFIRGLIERQA